MNNADTNPEQATPNAGLTHKTNAPKVPKPRYTDTTKATQARRLSTKQYDLTLIEAYAAAGLADQQYCVILGMGKSTWTKLKQREDVKQALQKGIENAVRRVEQSLFLKCLGYHVESEGKTKYIAPDTLAIMYYLNNKKPEAWKHQAHMSQDVTQMVNISDFAKLSTEEKKRLIQQMKDLKEGKKLELAPEQKQ